MVNYENGSIVWVRLSQKWWPGRVISLEDCPIQYTVGLKREPYAIVKFFNESGIHDVSKTNHIYPYNCSRKGDFIRKGLNAVKYDPKLKQKFEADVAMAEKLTGGNMEIVKDFQETNKRRVIDYSDLGFGNPKAKKYSRDQSMQKEGFSDIGEAIQYKQGTSHSVVRPIEHVVKIMEQPKPKTMDADSRATPCFKCYVCGFSCSRVNVIIWHNKAHLNKVENYDSGIRIPGGRKRRKAMKGKRAKKKPDETNGNGSPRNTPQGASQLLLDWEDEEEDSKEEVPGADNEEQENNIKEEEPTVNGVEDSENDDLVSDTDDAYDDTYPPPQKGQRHPMPKQIDINSAFDALLADSSPLHQSNGGMSGAHNVMASSSYANNGSDSDECSDWEKYYKKDSDEGSDSDDAEESDSKSLCEGENGIPPGITFSKSSGYPESAPGDDSYVEPTTNGQPPLHIEESHETISSKLATTSGSKRVKKPSAAPSPGGQSPSPQSPGPSVSKSSSPLPEPCPESTEHSTEEHSVHSTHSSSSSTSSGPAYMLVAVDAHGNNVPMPVLSEGGNHLVAVEASMEDGSTRTLYIDPAHLGPNVDLNNLMLHIDNSGQETVIIPTSTSDGEIISSTLVEQQEGSNLPAEGEEHSEAAAKPEVTESCRKREDPRLSSRRYAEAGCFGLMSSTTGSFGVSSTTERFRTSSGGSDHSSRSKKDKHSKEKRKDKKRYKEDGKKKDKGKKKKYKYDYKDLPNIEINVPKERMYVADEIVWVITHGLWWPSFVLKIYGKELKASILFINCQQKTPIKVGLNRLKKFSYLDYTDIFEYQKDKAAGLIEAMEMASHYRTLKDSNAIKATPREFFSLSVIDQRSIVNRTTLALRGVPMEPEVSRIKPRTDSGTGYRSSGPGSAYRMDASEDRLSERDKLKLMSAQKARRTANERFVRYIRSEPCLEHLRRICGGRLGSARHDYFKSQYQDQNFLLEVSGAHNTGVNFFGQEDTEQTEEVLNFLYKTLEKEPMALEMDSAQRRVYITTVLLPEAIKESMRILTKISEDSLEDALETGISETRTEKKARKLEFS